MKHSNSIEFKVYGKYALFTDPLTKTGGEKFTYQIPTYQALKGICESVYWKPTIQWIIDDVRIMKPIRMQSQGMIPMYYRSAENRLSIYTYLKDVEYEVRAHFVWNENRKDLIGDRNENKHWAIAKRMIERGEKEMFSLAQESVRHTLNHVSSVKQRDIMMILICHLETWFMV